MSTFIEPRPSTSSGASSLSTNEGTFWTWMRSALPSRQSATTSIKPPGASSVSRVWGSCIGRMPLSSKTVATQIEFDPDIGGVSSGSMMMKPIWARGSFGGTSRLKCRNTPPRGSLSRKFLKAPSFAMKRDCSHSVAPGGGATPPTTTSPTSPSAWQETTWMTLDECTFGQPLSLWRPLFRRRRPVELRQRRVDAGPARRRTRPDRGGRLADFGIVQCSDAHDDQVWARLGFAEDTRTAVRAEAAMHHRAAVGGRSVELPFPRDRDRVPREHRIGRAAAAADILANPAPADPRRYRRLGGDFIAQLLAETSA